jgi:cyclophilin family peptidyl-prolyl cis-trans isomerase
MKQSRSFSQKVFASLSRLWRRRSRRPDSGRFAYRLERLEERLALTHSPSDHVHADLSIFIDGQEVVIPPNIGLTATTHFNPHTHDFTGTLHIGEGGPAGIGTENRLVTLKDFFDVWRTTNVGQPTNNPNATFDSTHILDRVANDTHVVRMYVNGELNTEYENYTPHDGDRIVISYEPIAATAASPLLGPISNVTVLAGSPLLLPLDGFDVENQAITYTVSSSNPSVVQASVLSGNRSMRVHVPNFGDMTFQLLDNFVPRVTNAIVGLAGSGFYNGLTFHRVIDGFVIQGGSHNGTGGPNPNVADFDDQFHFDLQHNRAGLLSMAKSLDDTNDTQFFITDAATRHLDFNHSIFGILTDGDEVRDAINSVPTDANDRPLSSVIMETVQILNDNENGVLLLKAAPGVTSGSATITVTATDTDGLSTVRTFVVTIAPDTNNGNPFLSDIALQSGVSGQPIQFQLQANDVEGDAVVFGATKIGSVNYTVNVTSGGLVTVTPPAGFAGTFQVEVSAKAASLQSTPDPNQQITDVQKVTVNVAPTAPTSVDLTAASDSGASNTDNITNASSLSFLISGVTSGATVKLYAGSNVVAQGTASGTSITLSVTSATLGEGTHQFSATQTVAGLESAHTANLAVTFDVTPPPAFTSTPPTQANANSTLAYNAQNPDEGAVNFRYMLVNAPSGATIDAANGLFIWTPTLSQVGSHSFGISATDAAGNFTTQTLNIDVGQPAVQLAELVLSLQSTSGQPLSSLQVNQDFVLVGHVRDLRSNPSGIFAFFADVLFESNLATVTGAIQFGSQYANGTSGSTSTSGLIDEVGGVSGSLSPIGGGLKELFRVPMKATATGTLHFVSEFADIFPAHDTLLYGVDPPDPLSSAEIKFGTLSANINLTFTANNDTRMVNEDSSNNTINVLANDTIQPGSGNVLTIASVGTTSNGGTVTITADKKSLRYTPSPNFFGTETFIYTVENQFGASASATVTVTVNNVNDPPTATNDTFTVLQNSTNNSLNVLANDSAAPDANETLTVTAVGAGNQQGTIAVAPGGTGVRYTPKAGFTGTETFTYTISDGHGGTRQASVTVTVNPAGPTATNDTATVQEDSSATTINVLGNDTPAPGGGQTLTVQSVGTPNKGGTVAIGAGGANVVYTPAANFQGTETFTYTLTDGEKTATATVTVTVTNLNDPPTAVNDTLDAFKNSTTTLNVLANDLSAPDPAEVFTIASVTQGEHGTVAISSDGKSILYTPIADYVGPDSFTYTMSDAGGLTSTATVTLSVKDFIPSTLGGRVFLDADKDGVADANELGVAGVQIKLIGTAAGGGAVNLTTNTLGDGSYTFTNLAPGNYTVEQVQPNFLRDGKESTGGLSGAAISANDKFSIQLAQGTNGAGKLVFGELGKPRQLTRLREFFASTLRGSMLVSIPYTAPTTTNPNFPALVSPAWQNFVGNQWSQFHDFKFAVSNNNQQLRIELKNAQNQTLQATIGLSDQKKVLDFGTQNGQRLFRLLGNPTAFNFQPVAEGEDDAAISAALAALLHPADDHVVAAVAGAKSTDATAVDAALAAGGDWLSR